MWAEVESGGELPLLDIPLVWGMEKPLPLRGGRSCVILSVGLSPTGQGDRDEEGMRLTLKGAALAMLLLLSPVFGDKKTSINFPQWEIDEMEDAINRNYPNGLPLESLKYVFYAIRKSENGAIDHLAFGIIDPGCATDSYSEQAGWAICTVVKNYHRWLNKDKGNKLKSVEDFIPYLGAKYCPVGAKNDPTGLNAYWVKNVLFWYKKVQN